MVTGGKDKCKAYINKKGLQNISILQTFFTITSPKEVYLFIAFYR